MRPSERRRNKKQVTKTTKYKMKTIKQKSKTHQLKNKVRPEKQRTTPKAEKDEEERRKHSFPEFPFFLLGNGSNLTFLTFGALGSVKQYHKRVKSFEGALRSSGWSKAMHGMHNQSSYDM